MQVVASAAGSSESDGSVGLEMREAVQHRVRAWVPYGLREGLKLNASSFYALEYSWSTKGAQEFPFGVVVVSNETISQKLNESSVIYIGGPLGGQLALFWTMP